MSGKKHKKHQPTHLAGKSSQKKPPYRPANVQTSGAKAYTVADKSGKSSRARLASEKQPAWLPYLLAVLITVAVMAGLVVVTGYHGIIPMDPAAFPELSAKEGTLNAPDPSATPSEGNFLVVVNATPTVGAGERECRLEIVNLPGNPYPCVAELVRSDTREVLYTSHRIAPGQYVETVKLDRALEPGTYPCTVQYRLVDGNRVLTTDYPITLTVGGPEVDTMDGIAQTDMDVEEAKE